MRDFGIFKGYLSSIMKLSGEIRSRHRRRKVHANEARIKAELRSQEGGREGECGGGVEPIIPHFNGYIFHRPSGKGAQE